MVKFRKNYWRRSYQEATYGITGANLAWFRSKETRDWGELLLMMETLPDNNNVGNIDDKYM